MRLSVRDAGSGVPEAVLIDIAQPFTRGDAARSGVAGTGLGLAIASQTAAAHGGALTLTNLRPTGFEATIVWSG